MLDLAAYWRDHPPLHELVAAYLGVKPRAAAAAERPADPRDPSGIGGLLAAHPNGFVPA